MLEKLPKLIDPIALAQSQRELYGRIPLKSLSRLSESLVENNGEVEVKLSFSRLGILVVIQGHINGYLSLECQNCLETLRLAVAINVNLAIVKSLDQIDRLPVNYEPLVLETEVLSLHDLVEDELLLATPDFPKHPFECAVYEQAVEINPVTTEKKQQSLTSHPFSVLANFKKNTGDL
jgi:uncharacterized protein